MVLYQVKNYLTMNSVFTNSVSGFDIKNIAYKQFCKEFKVFQLKVKSLVTCKLYIIITGLN